MAIYVGRLGMLDLPSVTLVMVERAQDKLAVLAYQDCTRAIKFGDEVLLDNDPSWSKLDWCRFIWFHVPRHIRTSHMLLVQWDAGVWDTSMWRDEFLSYDFVGAPWWYPTKNVGNSGFALKSTRLARYIMDRAWEFPCDTTAEDDLLCRKYRSKLEDRGFRWAPDRLAHEFAFECSRPSPTSRHFGFHAMFNWPEVMARDAALARLRIAAASPDIRDSYMMRAFCQKHPALAAELANEEIAGQWLRSAPI